MASISRQTLAMAAEGQTKYVSSAHEWEGIYPRFCDLYEKCELKEVKKKLENHGFYATDNQYKKQITKWQKEGKLPPKHIKSSEYEFMIQKRMQRKAEEQKNTAFLYNGWEWPTEKIDRYRERYHREDSPPASYPLETPSCISYYTPSASRDPTPEAVDRTPFMTFGISLDRPWEYFVAQMILNQNVDFTIEIERNKIPDPLSRAAQLSAGSSLEKLFKKFRQMPVGATKLELPPVPSSVVEPSLLSMLEDKSLFHGLPEKALYHLSLVIRRYPAPAPDSDFEMDLLTFRMTHALNLKDWSMDTESTFGMPKSPDVEEIFKSIRDLPSVYRSTEINRQVGLICGYFDRVSVQGPNQPASSTKLSVVRRDLWQMVRLLLRSCEAGIYALEPDFQILQKVSRALYQSYRLVCSDPWLKHHFGEIENIYAGPLTKSIKPGSDPSGGTVFCCQCRYGPVLRAIHVSCVYCNNHEFCGSCSYY